MSRWFVRVAAAALLAATASGALALPALWTVTGPHAHLYLFGSVHVLPKGVDWEPPALAQAVSHADEVWFELPLETVNGPAAFRLVRARGALPRGASLFDRLGAAQAEKLRQACAKLQVPPAAVAPMRPWLAEVTLSLAEDAQAGADASQGVEQQISAQVPARTARRAFETLAEQIGFLADAPQAAQAASLEQTLTEVADDPGLYDRVMKAWLSQDLSALGAETLSPLQKASPVLYRRLIIDRNRRWARTLGRRLRGHGQIVVVVGAGHLLGPDGVPALLSRQGFDVIGPGFAPPAAAH